MYQTEFFRTLIHTVSFRNFSILFQAAFKNQFLTKMFANLEQTYLSPTDCAGLYKLFFEWILSSDQPNLIQHGHQQLVKLANRRTDTFREFVNPNLLIDVFTNTMHSNKVDTIILVGEILDVLSHADGASQQLNEDEIALSNLQSNIKDGKISKDRESQDLKRSVTNVVR